MIQQAEYPAKRSFHPKVTVQKHTQHTYSGQMIILDLVVDNKEIHFALGPVGVRGLVVQWLGRWTHDSKGRGLTPGHSAFR